MQKDALGCISFCSIFHVDRVTEPSKLSQCVQLPILTNTSLLFFTSRKVIARMSNLDTWKEMRCDGYTALQTVCTEKIIVKLKDNI